MNLSLSGKKLLAVFFLVAGLALVVLLWRVFNPSLSQVTEVSPASGVEGVALDVSGKVTFDRGVKGEDPVLAVVPEVEPNIVWNQERTGFEFAFREELASETTYQLTLTGQRILPFTWSFTTKSLVKLGTGSDDAAAAWQAYEDQNPLVGDLPVVTKDFKISRLGGKKFQVILYGADRQAAKQAALDWFGEHGTDPQKFELVWLE